MICRTISFCAFNYKTLDIFANLHSLTMRKHRCQVDAVVFISSVLYHRKKNHELQQHKDINFNLIKIH